MYERFESWGARRIATVETKVRDADDNLVAMGTGTYRIFEGSGNPIVWALRF